MRSPCPVRLAILPALAALLAGAAPAQGQAAAPPGDCGTIAAVEVKGNERMSADAVRFDLGIKPGDRWDEARLRREFRRFWNRGFFSDLRFFRRCTPEGAVLVVQVEERPTILDVSYDRTKAVTEQQIQDYFKEHGFSLGVGLPLDYKKLWRAERLIQDLLAQRGYLDAEVHAEIRETSPTARSVRFRIKTGGKTRIRELDFAGNEAFSDRRLRKQLELTREYHWWWPWSKKNLYHPLKYQQDINNVLEYYRNHGYLDADVRPPIVKVETKGREEAEAKARARARKRLEKRRRKLERKARKRGGEGPAAEFVLSEEPLDVKVKTWVDITVPVVEGKVYKLGEVRFSGNELFKDEVLRPLIPLREGSTLQDNLIEAGLELIRRAYGQRGYIYSVVTRRFERHEGEPVADVVIEIDEDLAYTVRRIEFAGNTTTHDEVLRRELQIFEGELLNRTALDISLQRLAQLGFWQPSEEPSLDPIPDKAQVDVTIEGQEQSRNEIQVGGGYQELEGGFFQASYRTSNFLGRGETLSLIAAVGGRFSQASINFFEPWFLGKPITFGFRLFDTSSDFGRARDSFGNIARLNRAGRGGSITFGKWIGNFTQVGLTYRYESTRSNNLLPLSVSGIGVSQNFSFDRFTTRIATLTPALSYRHVDFALRPTRGQELFLTPEVGLRALGGDIDFIRPTASASLYRHISRRLFVGLHGELAWVKAFGEIERCPGFVDGVPLFQRFFIGGDAIGPRVFETRSLFPERVVVSIRGSCDNAQPVIDPASGLPVLSRQPVGGSKRALVQFELGLPIGRTATLAGFVDAGGVYDTGVDINWQDARVSAGIEFRVFLPVFQAPIRLIYGWPVRYKTGDPTSRFQFAIGLPF